MIEVFSTKKGSLRPATFREALFCCLLLVAGLSPFLSTPLRSDSDQFPDTLEEAAKEGDVQKVRNYLMKSDPRNPRRKAYLEKTMFRAMENGYPEVVKKCVQAGADLEARHHQQNRTPLMYAIDNDQKKMINLLLSLGANVNATDEAGRTPLHLVVEQTNASMVKRLISSGAKMDVEDRRGRTPFHMAVQAGSTKGVQQFLSQGVDPSITDGNGRTPLYVAVREKKTEIVKALLDAGADPNVQSNGTGPVHLAARAGEKQMVQLLARNGADLDRKTKSGRSPAYLAAERQHENVVTTLQELGASVEVRDLPAMAPMPEPLKTALRKRDQKALTSLIKTCASEGKFHEKHLELALLKMVQDGHADSARKLIRSGVPVDTRFEKRENATPLIVAAKKGRSQMGKVLLKLGADVNARNEEGHTPLMETGAGGHTRKLKLLLDNGAEVSLVDENGQTALMKASRGGRNKAVSLLLDEGAEVHRASNHGRRAIHLAVQKGNVKTLEHLLEAGAEVNAPGPGGKTPLIYLCRLVDVTNPTVSRKKLNLLLEFGADVNDASSREGSTPPLLLAVLRDGLSVNRSERIKGNRSQLVLELVDTFLQRGASVHVQEENGNTPLHYAAKKGGRPIVRRLLEAGANPLVQNNSNKTVLDVSRGRTKRTISRFLLAAYMKNDFQKPSEKKRKRIQKWLKKLSSPQYKVREKALNKLKSFGDTVLYDLKRNRDHRNPEVRSRIREILQSIFRKKIKRSRNPRRLLPE